MEKIKKTILQALTTESVPCPSGITGPCVIIVPDLSVVYHMKINLTAELMDVGFLDAYVEESISTTYLFTDNEDNLLVDDVGDNLIFYDDF